MEEQEVMNCVCLSMLSVVEFEQCGNEFVLELCDNGLE